MGRFRRRGNDDSDDKKKQDKSSSSGQRSFGRGERSDDARDSKKGDDGSRRLSFGRGRSDDEPRAKPTGRGRDQSSTRGRDDGDSRGRFGFNRSSSKDDDRSSSGGRSTFGRGADRDSGGGLRSSFGRNRTVASSSGDPGGRSSFGRRGSDGDGDNEDESGGRRPFGRSTGSSPPASSSSPGGRTPFGRRGDEEKDAGSSRSSFGRSTGSSPPASSSSPGGRTPFGRRGDEEKDEGSSRSSFGRSSGSSPPASSSSSSGGRTPFGRRGDEEKDEGSSRLSFGRGGSSPPSGGSPPSPSGGRTSFGGRGGDEEKDEGSSRLSFGRSPTPGTPPRSTGERSAIGGRDTGAGAPTSGTFGRSTSPSSTPPRSTGERSAIGGRDTGAGAPTSGTFGRSSPTSPTRSTGERSAIGGRDTGGARTTGTFGRSSPTSPTRSTGERDSKKEEGGRRGVFGRGGSKDKPDASRTPSAKKDDGKDKTSRFGRFSRSKDDKKAPDKKAERGAKPAKAARASTKAKALPRDDKVPRLVGDGLSLDRKLDLLGGGLVILAAVMVFGWLQTTFSTTAEAQGFMAEIDVLFAQLFGVGRIAVVIILAYFGGWLLFRHFGQSFSLDKTRLLGYGILFVTLLITLHWWELFFIDFPNQVNYVPTKKILYEQSLALAEGGRAGGYFGHVMYKNLHSWAGDWVFEVFLFSMWLAGFYLAQELTVEKMANSYIAWRDSREARRSVEAVPAMVTATAAAGASGGSSSTTTRRQPQSAIGRKSSSDAEKEGEDKGTTRKTPEVEGRTQVPSDAPITADTDGDAPKRQGRGLFGRKQVPSDAPVTAATDGDAPKRQGRGILGRRKAPDDAVAEPSKPERKPVDAAAAMSPTSTATDEADNKPQRQGLSDRTGRTAKPDEKPETPSDDKSNDGQPKRRDLAERTGRSQADTDEKSADGDAPKRRGRGLFGRSKAPDDAQAEEKTPEPATASPLSRRLPDQQATPASARSLPRSEVATSAAVAATAIKESDDTNDKKPESAAASQPERRPAGGLSDRLSRRPSIAARPSSDEDADTPTGEGSGRGLPARRPSITSQLGRQTSDEATPEAVVDVSPSPMRASSRDSLLSGRRSPALERDTPPRTVDQKADEQTANGVDPSNGKTEVEDTQASEPTTEMEQPARPMGLPSRRQTPADGGGEGSTPDAAPARRSPFAARSSMATATEANDTSSIFRRRTVADAPPTDLPGRRPSSSSPDDLTKRDNPFARPAVQSLPPLTSDNGDTDDEVEDNGSGQVDRLAALVQTTPSPSEENRKSEVAEEQPAETQVDNADKPPARDFSDAARIAVEGAAMAKTGTLGRRGLTDEDAVLPEQPARPRGLPRPDADSASSVDMFRRQRSNLLSRRLGDDTEDDVEKSTNDDKADEPAPITEETIALPTVNDQSGAKESDAQLEKTEIVKAARAEEKSVPTVEKSVDVEAQVAVAKIAKTSVEVKSEEKPAKSDEKEPDKKESTTETPKGPRWSKPEFITLLEVGSEKEIDQQYLLERARLIEDTLESFGAPGRVVEVNTGPVITQFGVEPDYIERRGGSRSRVKVSAIASLDKDLALALAAKSIRIQAPVPGKGFVGIEVPNAESDLVSLRDVMNSKAHEKVLEKSTLTIGLGKRVDGGTVSADLTEMPHLLIAGATGSGKSVCVNAIICCLLLQNTPEDLQFIMVDPKRVELAGYNGIPHLVAPVVVDLERIVGVLKWVQREMDDRYRRFAAISARNIDDYNVKRAPEIPKMPYLVVVVDELADLMMLAPDETERLIARLAQMARATGIHLIISTQRPSVDVVTGLIKANFPARIAFAVASSVDSRVILDQPGAEKLLGRGDMLYQAPDAPAPLRMQGVYVSDPEINRINQYWKSTQALTRKDGQPQLPLEPPKDRTAETPPLPRIISRSERINGDEQSDAPESLTQRPPLAQRKQDFWQEVNEVENEDEAGENGDGDDLYEEAVDVVRTRQRASISMLQRTFRIGYTRAARLIDIMEENGVVGPAESGAKPRKVLLPPPDDEDNED